jgi:acyl-CoA dehydrogenase
MPLIREKIGRMATELDAARLLVYRAAWETDSHPGRHSTSAAMAKGFATEMAQRVVDEAVQIVGGLGVLVGHLYTVPQYFWESEEFICIFHK